MEQFSQLTPADKIEAILAAALEPISRELALKWAGVNVHDLTESAASEVEQVFQRWKATLNPQSDLYYVPEEHQRTVIDHIGVDANDVHTRIAQIGLETFGIHLSDQ